MLQLLAITVAHAVADVYVGIIAPVLVPMREHYQVSFGAMVFIAALLAFSANFFQVLVGNLKAAWSHAGLICGGVLLGGVSVFIPSLPVGSGSFMGMVVLALVAGLGVALVHPEGLRAVHGLKRIPTSFATAVFMVAGFMGFAGGALISALITDRWGIAALRWLYLLAPAVVVPLWLSGVRLPPETIRVEQSSVGSESLPAVPFVALFAIGTLLTISSQVQATLLPSYLHQEAGYTLSFSGLSFTLFGLGGMVGALLWGALAPRLGHLRVILVATLLGVPLTICYLWLAPQTAYAAILMVVTGFVVYVGYPLCVALARGALSGLRVTQRIGLMSGGTWAIAAVVLWCLGPLSDKIGIRILLHLIWCGYLVSAIMLAIVMKRMAQEKNLN